MFEWVRDIKLLCYYKVTKIYTPFPLVPNSSILVSSPSCKRYEVCINPLPTPYKHGKSCNFYILSKSPVVINTCKYYKKSYPDLKVLHFSPSTNGINY